MRATARKRKEDERDLPETQTREIGRERARETRRRRERVRERTGKYSSTTLESAAVIDSSLCVYVALKSFFFLEPFTRGISRETPIK